MSNRSRIPEQKAIAWGTVCAVSWSGLRRRMLRSMVTISCVVLAIAFVAYMLIINNITQALVEANDSILNVRLQETGVDIFAETQTDQMTVLLLGLALLTCTVGIVNSMLMAVTERIREIGTLKCLGARDMFIVKTYFFESTMQGICGSIVGMIVGCLIAVAVSAGTYGEHVPRHFPAGMVAQSLLIAFLCGSVISVLSAIAPAYAAARKQPVEALRVEE